MGNLGKGIIEIIHIKLIRRPLIYHIVSIMMQKELEIGQN